MGIKEVRVAHVGPQGLIVIKEALGPVVRKIEYDPNWPGCIIHKFSAKDGGIRQTMINLASCVWFEYDVEDEPEPEVQIEVDTNTGC